MGFCYERCGCGCVIRAWPATMSIWIENAAATGDPLATPAQTTTLPLVVDLRRLVHVAKTAIRDRAMAWPMPSRALNRPVAVMLPLEAIVSPVRLAAPVRLATSPAAMAMLRALPAAPLATATIPPALPEAVAIRARLPKTPQVAFPAASMPKPTRRNAMASCSMA